MSEPISPVAGVPPAAAFPGSTGVTVLEVYDWTAPDGLPGGSAHVHLASTEGYVVQSGQGRLQTLGTAGYAETPLGPGDCLWFTPGTIHRLVNDGGLTLLAVMQNAGLPEHGDAVLTFGPEVLADPGAYEKAAALPGPGAGEDAIAAAARERAALAVDGFLALRDAGPEALRDFYAAAVALRGDHIDDWKERWQAGSLSTSQRTAQYLYGVGARDISHLESGASVWRVGASEAPRAYGMCGRLITYPAAEAARVG